MKRIVLVFGTAASLLLSSGAMAAPKAKKTSEASCSCSDHKKDHAAHGKKAKDTCPDCGMKDCACDHKECAKCEHCQAAKADGKKDAACSCGHDHEKADAKPETKPETK